MKNKAREGIKKLDECAAISGCIAPAVLQRHDEGGILMGGPPSHEATKDTAH